MFFLRLGADGEHMVDLEGRDEVCSFRQHLTGDASVYEGIWEQSTGDGENVLGKFFRGREFLPGQNLHCPLKCFVFSVSGMALRVLLHITDEVARIGALSKRI